MKEGKTRLGVCKSSHEPVKSAIGCIQRLSPFPSHVSLQTFVRGLKSLTRDPTFMVLVQLRTCSWTHFIYRDAMNMRDMMTRGSGLGHTCGEIRPTTTVHFQCFVVWRLNDPACGGIGKSLSWETGFKVHWRARVMSGTSCAQVIGTSC